jgi:hypothetical protein
MELQLNRNLCLIGNLDTKKEGYEGTGSSINETS